MIGNLVTPDQLAERLGVKRRRVIEWNATYQWPHTRIGKHIYWTEAQVDAIMRTHTVAAGQMKTSDGRTRGSRARAAS